MESRDEKLADIERAYLSQSQAVQRECDLLGADLTQVKEEQVRVTGELQTVRANEQLLGEAKLKLEDRVRRLKAALQQAAEQNRALLEEGDALRAERDALREQGDALREQCASDLRTINELG